MILRLWGRDGLDRVTMKLVHLSRLLCLLGCSFAPVAFYMHSSVVVRSYLTV